MSIVTKTGDRGKTALLSGKQVSKDHIRIEICGCLDELGSFLGLARSLVRNKSTKGILEAVQSDLFMIGSQVSTDTRNAAKLKTRISEEHVRKLEEYIVRAESKTGKLDRHFYIPGRNVQAAAVNVARAIARRAERRVVTLDRRENLQNPHIVVYLNRLSDLLFILSLSLEPAGKKRASR